MDRPDRALYRYRFADIEFDEARATLHVAGKPTPLEQRPTQVLVLLLERADEVVPRQKLFDTVWEGRPTVDNVLANAIAKLRKALGAAGTRIVTVPRVGYRLVGPIERAVSGGRTTTLPEIQTGHPVPGREHFILRECLDPRGNRSVWLVRHDKTDEPRVYKFATDGARLTALKREVTVHRVLQRHLGAREGLVRVVDWNFAAAPFWLQSEYAGRDLAQWAREEPAWANAPKEQRIAWFLAIANVVAAAHEAGVLHKDLKPSNVLVAPDGKGWRFRVSDFGSARFLEPGRLDELGITPLGMTISTDAPAHAGTTLLYLAPEILAGRAPSIQSDVYALGLLLFQMATGDLRRTLATGWEQAVDDALLREDIADATHGDPRRRLASVDALIQRMCCRDARAMERTRLRESDAHALALERALECRRARRPWLVAAVALLAVGCAVSVWQMGRVRVARTQAERQAHLAQAVNQFLDDELFGAQGSAAWAERNATLRETIDAAAARLDKRFAGKPMALATLHQTLGHAYLTTEHFKKAAMQLQAAAENWQRATGPGDPRTLLAQYQLASILARTSRLDEAKAVLQQSDAAVSLRPLDTSDVALYAHMARGDLAFRQTDYAQAVAQYRQARTLQRALHPHDPDLSARILLAIAGCQLRLQRPEKAETTAREVLAGSPYTLVRIGLGAMSRARIRLAQALRAQGRFNEASAVTQKALAEVNTVDPKANGVAGIDARWAKVLAGMKARMELRRHRPGAADDLRGAIVAMQAGGVPEAEISDFRTALSGDDPPGRHSLTTVN